MREIVLDTETTGLDPADGHRIVEIAGIELVNHMPSGRVFHRHVNPERDIPEDAYAVHGLSAEFLAGFPAFASHADELLEFLGEEPLRCEVEDTLALARRRFPGAQASLDALCRRFAIDLAARTKHGALLDCELLAAVYLELIGGRQPGLEFIDDSGLASAGADVAVDRPVRPARPHAVLPEELAAHAAMLQLLTKPIWLAAG